MTGLVGSKMLSRMMTAPFNLFEQLIFKIQREAENAREGKQARIIAKINALNEPQIIDALYDASRALSITDRTVRRDWIKARAWLHRELA